MGTLANVVYALFDSRDATDPVVTELLRREGDREPFVMEVHEGRLDTLDLPDDGTEVGRNTIIADVSGAVIGAVWGGVLQTFMSGLGLDLGSAIIGGGVTGLLVAHMSVLMSGTRDAKVELRELETLVESGRILVTVWVRNRREQDLVMEVLEGAGGEDVGVC